jgi:hypothetical protein
MADKLTGLIEDYDLRVRMSQGGRKLVDGMGTDRVVRSLLES